MAITQPDSIFKCVIVTKDRHVMGYDIDWSDPKRWLCIIKTCPAHKSYVKNVYWIIFKFLIEILDRHINWGEILDILVHYGNQRCYIAI